MAKYRKDIVMDEAIQTVAVREDDPEITELEKILVERVHGLGQVGARELLAKLGIFLNFKTADTKTLLEKL